MFEKLRGCRVVEGFVQILLFDNVHESVFSNISFPELREITDFLLLYRVNGLRTLENLFPNLAVIRGQNTFYNHALIIFEMPSLQEIGLYSLTDIMYGSVRIDKNPSLCFIDSIDWDLIAKDNSDHFIKKIKSENECPLCPGDETNVIEYSKLNGLNIRPCPKAKYKPWKSYLDGKHLCWNRQKCQKICDNCTACNDNGCCDNKCLGGCEDDSPKACHVCKNITMVINNDVVCLDKCPPNLYEVSLFEFLQ